MLQNSIEQLLSWASTILINSESPQLDAEVLLTFCLNKKSRSYLRAWPEKIIAGNPLKQFKQLIEQRSKGHPIAYLTSEKEFWSRSFLVTQDVLIPRPETELLIEVALTTIAKGQTLQLADLGTGSGAIAITLGLERPNCIITAIDSSPAALTIAKQNARSLNANSITFIESHWLTETRAQQFDLIISNPPYIDSEDAHLQQGDVRFEPLAALVADNHGLKDFESIIKQARSSLTLGGQLLFEHGFEQHKEVQALFNTHGFEQVSTYKDLLGYPRVTKAQWNG